jgi:alpha-beta hydrolase superfamily lysophospholipase
MLPRLVRTLLTLGLALLSGGCQAISRQYLFFPTHQTGGNLADWRHEDRRLGAARPAEKPEHVWLLLHGNAGQASFRDYVLPRFSPRDSVYVLEYPGYGDRPGKPSIPQIDEAAREAYRIIRELHPSTPVGVVGESLGTGPAAHLALAARPPDKIVLITPYDNLAGVGRDHVPYLPVRLILGSAWDNRVIRPERGRRLALGLPQARLVVFPGGHNDWSRFPSADIRFP